MSESGTTAVDSGPLAANGSYVGTDPTEGRFGVGRGVTLHHALRANGLEASTLDQCTLALWIRWADSDTIRTVFRSQLANHPLLFRSQTQELGLFLNNRGGHFGSGFTPSGWQVGDWRHVAVTCDRTTGASRYYVDGVEVGVISQEFLSDGSGDIYFGNLHAVAGFGQPAGSAMDDAVAFQRVLTPTEITELFTGPEPTVATTPSLPDEVIAGDTVQRDPGSWESHDNGGLTVSSRLQIRPDPATAWQELPGSGAESYTLPHESVGQQLRLVATAINAGGSSAPAYGAERLIASSTRLRLVAAANSASSRAAAAAAAPTAGAMAATTFTNSGSLP